MSINVADDSLRLIKPQIQFTENVIFFIFIYSRKTENIFR